MNQLLLVEDDPILLANTSELLRAAGFEVTACLDSAQAMTAMAEGLPDLALLDISLGREADAGFALCTELRRRSESLPIIFLSSHDTDADKISGLRLGADDYLTKDVSTQYLVVRIQTLLRRTAALRADTTPDDLSAPLKDDSLSVDEARYEIRWRGERVDLSLTQFWMVHALVDHPGHVKTHAQLMEAAHIYVTANTVATHIKNMRRAFQKIDADFDAIKAERGLGYRWAE